MPRAFCIFVHWLVSDGTQRQIVEHECTYSPHTVLQTLLKLTGILVSFAVPGGARNDLPTVSLFTPSKPLKISFMFSHTNSTCSIFLGISRSIQGSKVKNTNFSHLGPTDLLQISFMCPGYPILFRWPVLSETSHWVMMSFCWCIHLLESIFVLFRIFIFIS